MRRDIPLVNTDLVAVVDDVDWEGLASHRWYLSKNPSGHHYALRFEDKKGVLMHTDIVKPAKGHEVDHWDGVGLHNWRSNLREATRSQNHANRRKLEGCKSQYKGVSRDSKTAAGRWRVNYATKYIGTFDSEEEAAKVYDELAFKLHGQFALLNFPDLHNS